MLDPIPDLSTTNGNVDTDHTARRKSNSRHKTNCSTQWLSSRPPRVVLVHPTSTTQHSTALHRVAGGRGPLERSCTQAIRTQHDPENRTTHRAGTRWWCSCVCFVKSTLKKKTYFFCFEVSHSSKGGTGGDFPYFLGADCPLNER